MMASTISHLATNPGGPRAGGSSKTPIEPLQRFTEAKRDMSSIYNELGQYVDELWQFYEELKGDNQKLVPDEQLNEVERSKEMIKTVKSMLGRDKMKVVFFGRTSNGKSSVINAMLHSKILPQGMGHTTCCFIQVEGGTNGDQHFIVEGSNEKVPLSELNKVGHAICAGDKLNKSLGSNTLIRVMYPKSTSKLLQNEVLLVDSPGVDVNMELDSWIDKHCLDADVFVLTVHSEQTLTQAEKNFFMRVSKKLSKPNIFILCNRWDASASEAEEDRRQIRAQHEQQFIQFLTRDMNVCSVQEAKSRFYFISAREVLEHRLTRKQQMTNPYQASGFMVRLQEFENFEDNFEKCISKSAIKTKFEAHNRRANEVIESITHNLSTLFNLAQHEKQRLSLDWNLKNKEFNTCRENIKNFEARYQQELRKLRSEVHLKVSNDFTEEIYRLESILDRFIYKFVDDPVAIDDYKANLSEYVNKLVTQDLETQLIGGLIHRIISLEQDMNRYVKEVLGEKFSHKVDELWAFKQPFKFVIMVNCDKLVNDFREDLEFRFSLGIENIARWVLSITRGQPITSIDRHVLNLGGTAHRRQRAANEPQQLQKQDVDAFLTNLLISSATYLVNGSVGVAIAGLVVYKNVDWRWIASGVGLIGGLYVYERWKWNTGAKEERLKKQFRSHLEQRLHQVEGVHTGNCEAQVINELDGVYEGLKSVAAVVHRDMKEGIDNTTKGMQKIDTVVKDISTMRNKTEFVSTSLESFAQRFLMTSP